MKQLWKNLFFIGMLSILILAACQPQAGQVQATQPAAQNTAAQPAAQDTATQFAVQVTPTPRPGATHAFTAQPVPTLATLAGQNTQEAPGMNEVPIPTPFNPALQAIVDQARKDLASKLTVDASMIELVGASSVTWPDGSLGCPQPGMMYTQIVVDGMLIRFKAGGQTYEYHSGGSRAPFLCKNPLAK